MLSALVLLTVSMVPSQEPEFTVVNHTVAFRVTNLVQVSPCLCPTCTCEPRCLCAGGKCGCPACGLASYADVYARVKAGEEVTLCVGVPSPAGAKGVRIRSCQEIRDGVYRFRLHNGTPSLEPFREVSASVPFAGTPAFTADISAQRVAPSNTVSPATVTTAPIYTVVPTLNAVLSGGTNCRT